MAANDYTAIGGMPIFGVTPGGVRKVINVIDLGDGTGALAVAGQATGVGLLVAMPTPNANGAPLATPPYGASAVQFILQAASSFTFALATAQPGSPPTPTALVNNPTGAATLVWTIPIVAPVGIYITAVSGTVVYRFV